MVESLKVLCVEDDEDVLYVTAIALGLDENILVHVADGADVALPILLDPNRPIDCILLDVRMPRISGIDLLSKIRKMDAHHRTPVVFFTASIQEGDVAAYARLDIAGVITKPYNPLTLASELREIIGGNV